MKVILENEEDECITYKDALVLLQALNKLVTVNIILSRILFNMVYVT